MTARDYTARTPIEHDGVRYEEGERLSLTDDQAAPLQALGAIKPVRARALKAKGDAPAGGEGEDDSPPGELDFEADGADDGAGEQGGPSA